MDIVRSVLERRGGVLRRRDLLAEGVTDRQLSRAVRNGSVIRARQGWYAVPGLPHLVVRALRVGGFVAGLTALESYGVWVPRRGDDPLQMARNAARFAERVDAAQARIRWGAVAHPVPDASRSAWRVPLLEALAQVLAVCDRMTAVALADSILNLGLAHSEAVRAVFDAARAPVPTWFAAVDGRADAGGETVARLRLVDAGIAVEPQYVVPGAGPFDLRVSARGLLEIDGRAHHDSTEAFLRDREKDLLAAEWGFTVLRITYEQLERQWPVCLAIIRRWNAEHGRFLDTEG